MDKDIDGDVRGDFRVRHGKHVSSLAEADVKGRMYAFTGGFVGKR